MNTKIKYYLIKLLNNKPFWFILIILLVLLVKDCSKNNQIERLEKEIDFKTKLFDATNDSLRTYVDNNNRLVSEKLTLQGDLNELNKIFTDKESELLSEISKLGYENKLIAAALIKAEARIKDLVNSTPTVLNDSTVIFTHESDTLRYDIRVSDIKFDFLNLPKLNIVDLTIPFDQVIDFKWDDNKRKNYPVSFSVRYSNPMLTAYDIESYVIPELQYKELRPNLWKRTNNFIKTNKRPLIIGTAIGVGLGYLFFN